MATLTQMENGEIRVENTTVLIKGAMERFKFGAPMDAKVNISEIENSVVVDIKEKRVRTQTEYQPIYEDKDVGVWAKYYDGDDGERGKYEMRLTGKENKFKELGKERIICSIIKAVDKMYENFYNA